MHATNGKELRALIANYVRYGAGGTLMEVQSVLRDQGGKGFLFGGAIRDLVLYGMDACPRDFDVVVDGVKHVTIPTPIQGWSDSAVVSATGEWAAVTKKYEDRQGKTECWNVKGYEYEIWSVQQQWSLPEDDRIIQKVPHSIFLTTEAVVASISDVADDIELYDAGFLAAMNLGQIDSVVRLPNRPEEYLKYAVKAAVQSLQHRLRMTDDLKKFVVDELSKASPNDVKEVLRVKYGTDWLTKLLGLLA